MRIARLVAPSCLAFQSFPLGVLLLSSMTGVLPAADQTWSGGGPSDNWSTSDLNWDAGAGWTQNNSAIFGGTGEAITLTEPISAGSLTFDGGGYMIGGSTLTLAGGASLVTVTSSGHTAMISSVIDGSAGFTKTGAGTLLLGSTSANTFAGQLLISGGTVRLNGLTNSATATSALGAGGVGNETVVQSGATLDINGHVVNATEIIRIAGSGTGGAGALVNTAANSNLNNLNRVVLTADATIGGSQRFDIRGGTSPTLDLAGSTLTKTGTNQFSVVGGTITSGNILINQGTFSLETTSLAQGDGTITIASGGTLGLYGNTAGNITRFVVSNAGTISNLGSNGTLSSNVQINAGATTISGGNSQTFAGGITGAGSLNITSSNAVTLSGNNTYTGGTTVGQNVRVHVNANAMALGTGTVTVQGDGTVNDGQVYLSGAVTLGNNFSISGQGGNSADTTQRGALRVDSGAIINGNVALAGAAGIGVNSGTGTITGVISGSAAFTKRDGGTLVLAGTNTYTGNTTLTGGTLQVGGAGSLNSGNYAGTITLGANAFQYASSANQILSGAISGTGTVTKSGGSILTLSGTNTYTGATNVNAGTLSLTGTLTSALSVASGARLTGTGSTTGAVSLASGSAIVATGGNGVQGATVTTAGPVTIFSGVAPTGSATTFNLIRYAGGTSPGTANFAASAANYRSSSLADTGSAIQMTYTGDTRTWNLTSGGSWDVNGATSPWTEGDQKFFWGDAVSFGNTAANQTITLTGDLAPASIAVSNAANTYTFSGTGALVGAGALSKSGNGTLVFTNTTANTYSGGTTISGGMITLGTGGTGANTTTASALGTGDVTIQSGATLQLWIQNTNTHAIANNIQLNGGTLYAQDGIYNMNGKVTLTGSNTFTTKWSGKNLIFTNAIGGSGNVTITENTTGGSTGGTVIYSGANSYSGTTTISSSTILKIGGTTDSDNGASGSLGTGAVTNNGTLNINRTGILTLGNTISGTGAVNYNSPGATFVSGTNSYTGVTTIRGSSTSNESTGSFVQVNSIGNGGVNGNLGAASNAAANLVFGQSGSTTGQLNYVGAGESSDRLFTINGHAVIVNNGTGALNFTNTGTIAHTTTGGHTLALGGSNTANNTFSPVIADGTSAISLAKSGVGTWILGAANTYTGSTTISAGTLAVGGSGTLGNGSYAGAISNSGTFRYASSANQTLSGNITGTGALVKQGSGTLTLTGAANSYSGTTTVSAGTLLVNGTQTGSGAVSVGSSGTFGGTGIMSASVTIQSGGTFSPGASIESLRTGSVTFQHGSTFAMELDSSAAPSAAADLLVIAGNLGLNGTVDLTLENIAGLPVTFDLGSVYSLINYSGAWNGGLFTYDGNLLADDTRFDDGFGNIWLINYNDTAAGSNFTGDHLAGSFVNLTSVPEPGALVLAPLGMLALTRRRRRVA